MPRSIQEGIRVNYHELLAGWVGDGKISAYWVGLLEAKYKRLALKQAMAQQEVTQ